MKAAFLLDTNVLIAMAWTTHVSHKKALGWLATHASLGWATCPLTQAGFVRVVSNPAFSPNALSPRDALALLQSNLTHTGHTFWADAPSLAEAVEPFSKQISGHQQINDAYLLGLAIHKGGKIATMDRAILGLLPEKSRASNFIQLI